MKVWKRALSLLIAAALLAGALPAALAAPADEVETRPLKVLCIGHSFAVNAMENLYAVAHAEGLETVLGLAYYSGCTLAQHVSFAANDSAVYRYYKNDASPTRTITQNVTLLSCILDENWDIIVLQNGTSSSGQKSAYQPYLDQLIAYVDAHKTNPDALYVWHQTWAFQAGYPTAAFTADSQITLYENICSAVQQIIVPDARFRAIIPSGTAVQNARTSYFGDNLTRDGQHMNELGKLITAYTWYCALTGRTLDALAYPYVSGKALSAGDQRVVLESINNAMQTPFALTPSAYAPGSTTHYTWNTVRTTGSDNLAALPANVMYEAEGARTKAFLLNQSTFYETAGPRSFISYAMYNAMGSYTNSSTGEKSRYGLPYRTIVTENTFYAIDENLWFDLAQMPALDTSGVGAVNLSMDYMHPNAGTATNVAFSKGMQVYVSLDGETFLPGYAGVRSVKLQGGGRIGSTEALLYRIETENLLDIPGVERGDVIRRIRIMPNGTYCRTFGAYYTSTISVNTYSSPEAFDVTTPRDEPEMIDLGEDAMRAIPVAEGVRTANIPWTTPRDITTIFPAGSSAYSTSTSTRTYPTGKNYRGPVYERDIDSTRELFASSIVDGVYGYNGAGFAPDDNGKNTAYGMDCQTFAFNAISRVSRSNAWSVMNTFGETYTRLVGDLVTAPRPFYSDIDIVDLNTPQQMYEHYALAKPGDLCIHYMTNKSNSVHTRVVKRVSVSRNSDGTIDGSASKMYFTEQTASTSSYSGGAYYSTSRAESSHTFQQLLDTKYVVYTLTDYAAGKVEKANIQAVCAPLVKDGTYADGVHLAFSSNYRIIKYTVTLRDVTNSADLFSKTKYSMSPDVLGCNFEDAELNALLADLPDGEYSIDVAVDSGPLTSTTQEKVPTTVKSFGFIRGKAEPCMGNHTGRKALTQAYLDKLTLTTSGSNGAYWTLPTGTYYLAEDLELTHSIRINSTAVVTLCLNGHTLRGTLAADSKTNRYYQNAMLYVAGTLNLCDHTDRGRLQVNVDGEITDKTYAAYVMQVGGQFNFYSGSICDSVGRYGAILVNGSSPNGEMNMYGGTISGNRNISGYSVGAAVELQNNGILNLYDGEITGNGNAGAWGSGVDANGASFGGTPAFNMYGGRIAGNTAKAAAVRATTGGTIRMSGGVIEQNTTAQYGSVYVYGTSSAPGTFEMSGGTIDGNTCSASTDQYGRGGGVALGSYGVYEFSGGTVSNNSALSGGGISVNSASAMLNMTYGAQVTGNRATGETEGIGGGGVAVYAGTANLSGGVIHGNRAVRRGGGVSAADGTVTAVNVTVRDNAVTGAQGAGGGLFLGAADGSGSGPALTMMDGTLITGNTADAGSGLYLARSRGSMIGGELAGSGGTSALCLGGGASFFLSGGVIGARGSAGSVLFRGGAGETVTGEFTGGTVYLPISTEGEADHAVTLAGGSFAGIGSSHRGVTVTGGQFASPDNVLVCAPAGTALTDSGDEYFRYALTEPQGTPGDFTGDGKVNAKDIVLLQRFIAGGYGASLDESKADLTGDGKMNAKDIVLLQRFVAGGYGVTL